MHTTPTARLATLVAGLLWASSCNATDPADPASLGGPDAGGKPPAALTACDAGNDSIVDERSGTCYAVMATPSTWDQARAACAEWGAGTRLVTLQTQAEWDFVAQFLARYPGLQFWIGASGAAPEGPEAIDTLAGPWRWLSDEPVDDIGAWAYKQPSQRHVRACAFAAWSDGMFRWSDTSCSAENYFELICEVDPR